MLICLNRLSDQCVNDQRGVLSHVFKRSPMSVTQWRYFVLVCVYEDCMRMSVLFHLTWKDLKCFLCWCVLVGLKV